MVKGILFVFLFFILEGCVVYGITNNKDVRVEDVAQILIASAQQNTNVSKLHYLCDTFGPRFCGTPLYTAALDWILDTMKQEALENVHGEEVTNITNWQRGDESLTLISPRNHKLALLGLGNSIGTGPQGITAQVLVVRSFAELSAKSEQAKGKIVVYNVPFTTYGQTVQYRSRGAISASQVGAVAALVRSVTPFSLYTPHTGATNYQNGIKQIPIAAITIEDAELLDRCQSRGQNVAVSLFMGATTRGFVTERNIIAEIKGAVYPEQVVLMGGHSDSWDVGQGAMDDGGGLFCSWEALRITLRSITRGEIPRPKRTIRVVLWTNEELGQRGAAAYRAAHLAELKSHVLAIESDTGNFSPNGFGFSNNNNSSADLPKTIQQVGRLLAPIGAGNITNDGLDTDNGFLFPEVPCAVLLSDGFDPVSCIWLTL